MGLKKHFIYSKYNMSKSIYPKDFPLSKNLPKDCDFAVQKSDNKGIGIKAKRSFAKGEILCEIQGQLSSTMTLHSLQIDAERHLHDPWFSGLLLHSCSPNTLVFMPSLRIIAQENIQSGDWLTMDYATTEAILYRQFKCHCGASNCRRWITGYNEISFYKESEFNENIPHDKQ